MAGQGLSYAVDLVFCIDVTGSMSPILDQVKANALKFYGDVQETLKAENKQVDQLRVRVVAYRDFEVDGADAIRESVFYNLPQDQDQFSNFVKGLSANGGGDEPESGLHALALAINSDWWAGSDKRRHVIVVWTDASCKPLDGSSIPSDLESRIPKSFDALTDLWAATQSGPRTMNSQRLIIFAPDAHGWSDIGSNWDNTVHHPSRAGAGLSDVDYKTVLNVISNSV